MNHNISKIYTVKTVFDFVEQYHVSEVSWVVIARCEEQLAV